jgi:hypothetical protein
MYTNPNINIFHTVYVGFMAFKETIRKQSDFNDREENNENIILYYVL